MQDFPESLYWLVGSLLAAIVIDVVLARVLLQFLRPASAYVFLVGRGSKLAALFAWLGFFTSFWYPRFLPAGADYLWMVKAGALAVGGVLLLLAFTSMPRSPHGKAGTHV